MFGYSVDWTNWAVMAVLCGTGTYWAVSEALLWLNGRTRRASRNEKTHAETVEAHPLLEKLLPFDKYCRTLDYSDAKSKFGTVCRWWGRAVTFTALAVCAYPALFGWLESYEVFAKSMTLTLVAVQAVVLAADTLLSLPFAAYRNFSIEERFGFNTQTWSGWFGDQAKEFAISLAYTSAVTAACNEGIRWFLMLTGLDVSSLAFVGCAVACAIAFSLAWEAVWINFIAPLFNKFEPMKDGEMKDRIMKLISDAGFTVSGIYVMDASRRSRHGNAYFCGWGRWKRIVLYDTIFNGATDDEILTTLAHETGHLVHRDCLKDRVVGAVWTATTTAVTVKLVTCPWLYNAFGFSQVTAANVSDWYLVGFSLAGAVIRAFMWLLAPFESWLSRKAEYAADAYATEHVGAEPNATGLIKLYVDSLGNLNVHPWYEAWFFDHPSLKNRLKAIAAS